MQPASTQTQPTPMGNSTATSGTSETDVKELQRSARKAQKQREGTTTTRKLLAALLVSKTQKEEKQKGRHSTSLFVCLFSRSFVGSFTRSLLGVHWLLRSTNTHEQISTKRKEESGKSTTCTPPRTHIEKDEHTHTHTRTA